jgi:hypothetical protein
VAGPDEQAQNGEQSARTGQTRDDWADLQVCATMHGDRSWFLRIVGWYLYCSRNRGSGHFYAVHKGLLGHDLPIARIAHHIPQWLMILSQAAQECNNRNGFPIDMKYDECFQPLCERLALRLILSPF